MSQKGSVSPQKTTPPQTMANTTAFSSTAATKLCHIVKRPDFEGYGFNLHSEKAKPGQYIGKVDANSPAESAGLKEGDLIIEVNGVSISNETHKQVVQRIKAISNEVRLLLIDVDGKGATTTATASNTDNINKNATVTASPELIKNNLNANNNNNASSNNTNECIEYRGTVQEIKASSANISSISMVSTKRMSTTSSQSNSSHTEKPDLDVTDKGITAAISQNGTKKHTTDNNNEKSMNASILKIQDTAISTTTTQTPIAPIPVPAPATTMTSTPRQPSAVANVPQSQINSISPATSTTNKAGSLQLPMTAAEMRAKLMSKKKYDPKNESVDLKKKFEIIQKL